MALSCRQVVELVTDYLEGELDTATATQVREHLAVCDGCETYVQQIRQMITVLGDMPVAALPERAQQELMAAFRDFQRG